MVNRLALAAAACLIAGCINPSYRCTTDLDCDLGQAGRCELDHRCTAIDPSCATNRSYAANTGPEAGRCFDDRVVPANLCAAGQPPATADGCAATVCQAVPSCCRAGWSEACVQQAQLRCSSVVCDTRIAITASNATATELWDLRWNGAAWRAERDPRTSVLGWVAPAPGSTAPRLAGFMGAALVGDDFSIPVAGNHSYFEIGSVDFDRDGRATAVLAFTDTRAGAHLEITKLDDGSTREIATAAANRLSWGDVNQDAFPDGIAESGAASTGYRLLQNSEAADHRRDVDDRVAAGVTAGTSGIPVRSFDWSDLDADHELDAVAYGYSVDVHPGKGGAIGPSAQPRFDCDPPSTAACVPATETQVQTFAGAALPASTGNQALVLASSPVRGLYRTELRGAPMPYTFAGATCGATCPPIIAVVVRDLDGDHALDVIAIDGDLRVFTGLARDNLVLHEAFKVPTAPVAAGFTVVRTSVTGAPQ